MVAFSRRFFLIAGGGLLLFWAMRFSSAYAFDQAPWFSTFGKVAVLPFFSYQHYPAIDRSMSSYYSHDQIFSLYAKVHPIAKWEVQGQYLVSHTSHSTWRTQCMGVQVRYLVSNDLEGSPVCCSIGPQLFYVPNGNRTDPSSPYHPNGNLAFGVSIGKEWSHIYTWTWKWFGWMGIGKNIQDPPWIACLFAVRGKILASHQFELCGTGYFGLGRESVVTIPNFDGYGRIGHRSVDLSLKYVYTTRWGGFQLQYLHRIYARAFPKRFQAVTLGYHLPLTFF